MEIIEIVDIRDLIGINEERAEELDELLSKAFKESDTLTELFKKIKKFVKDKEGFLLGFLLGRIIGEGDAIGDVGVRLAIEKVDRSIRLSEKEAKAGEKEREGDRKSEEHKHLH